VRNSASSKDADSSLTGIVAVTLPVLSEDGSPPWGDGEKEKAPSTSSGTELDGLSAPQNISTVKCWVWALAATGGAATTKPSATVRAARPGSSAQRVVRPHPGRKPLRVLMPRKLALDMSNCRGGECPKGRVGARVVTWGLRLKGAAHTFDRDAEHLHSAMFSAPLAAGGAPLSPESVLSVPVAARPWQDCDGSRHGSTGFSSGRRTAIAVGTPGW